MGRKERLVETGGGHVSLKLLGGGSLDGRVDALAVTEAGTDGRGTVVARVGRVLVGRTDPDD